MGFGLDPEHGHCRGRGPSASRGARTGHHQGKAKAARLTRTAFLGSGEWRHWRRRGQAREKRTGGRRKKAYAGLPLEPEKSLSIDLLRPPRPPPPWPLRTPHLSLCPAPDAPPPSPCSAFRPTPRLPLPSCLPAFVSLLTPRLLPPPTPAPPSRLCTQRPASSSLLLFTPLPSLHASPLREARSVTT